MPLLQSNANASARASGSFHRPRLREMIVSSNASLSSFQVQVIIPWRWNMRTDFADLKFFQGVTSCPYWIEDYTAGQTARVWVKIPTINNGLTSINVTPDGSTGNSNGVNTFEWFEDFTSGGYGSGKWTLTNTTGFSVTNSGVPSGGLNSKGLKSTNHMLKGTSTDGKIYGSSGWAGNYETWSRSYSPSTAPNGFTRDGFGGVSNANENFNFLDHATDAVYIRRNEAWTYGNSFSSDSTPSGGSLRNNWMRISHRVVGNTGWQYIEDSTGKYIGPRQPNDGLGITLTSNYRAPALGMRGDQGVYSQSYECYWDAFWVKKATTTEPTVRVV